MRVGRFEARYEQIEAIHGLPADELRTRDLRRPQPSYRWWRKMKAGLETRLQMVRR